MRIIAITAPKHSGKNVISDYLVQNYGYKEYAFAEPIKKACKEIFLFSDEQLYGNLKETIDERWGISPREALQVIGTEIFQYKIHDYINSKTFNQIGRGVWVHRFKLMVESMNIDDKLVISDLRFPHEAEIIKQYGGEIWRIQRPSLANSDTHSSETEYNDIEADKLFINDGSIYDLQLKIKNEMENIKNNVDILNEIGTSISSAHRTDDLDKLKYK
jgi:hypothetical protein